MLRTVTPGPDPAGRRLALIAAQLRRQAVGQRFERELLGRVDLERGPDIVDEPDRAAQAMDVGLRRVFLQRIEPIAVVGELGSAVGDAGDIAQPQAGERQALVEGEGVRAAVAAARLLIALALGALALLGRQVVELLDDRVADLAGGSLPAGLGN